MVDFGSNLIGELCRLGALSVSEEEARGLIDWVGLGVVSKRSVASRSREAGKRVVSSGSVVSVVLPFCGEIMKDNCLGVRYNHGLHTQCRKSKVVGNRYCNICMRQAENNASGVPNYGDIEDRAKFGVNYIDPKGRMSIPYANVVDKLGIKMSVAVAAASSLGWSIPAEQLIKRVRKRGRPAKSAAVSDTDSEVSNVENVPKKRRGRPAKAKKSKVVSQDDQIALLVAEAYAETTGESKISVTKKTEEKAAEKAAEKTAEKAAEKTAEKTEEKAAEKTEEKAAEKTEEKAAEKTKEKTAEKTEEKTEEKMIGKKKPNKRYLKKKDLQKEAFDMGLEISDEELNGLRIGEMRKKIQSYKKNRKMEAKKIIEEKEELIEDIIEEVEDDGIELSETITVDDVEYYIIEQDGQKIVLSMDGEPVGVYDDESDTIQEAEFE
jgi:flagellar biosynthesis GTPase FlhF